MTDAYHPNEIEKKWQKEWKEVTVEAKNKKYVLDMFPYPSGATMHVGHLEGYVGTDVISRYLRMKDYSVLHPMGWDAFGLPAENYAIKTGIHPNQSTHENIKTFKSQLMASGLSYDWSREIDTSSPEYYKWTQWLFTLMFKRGLAYKKKAPVNWCPKDETVLANEQVVDGKCERCDTPVIQKELEQWFFKITAYADKLISGLDKIDWLDEVKRQQINWIGRSEGMKIHFGDVEVFTTRPDTLSGVTFVAIAGKFEDSKEKLGKFTGKYVINPLTKKEVPVWEVNYVRADYGTGAVMGVPAHDERDMEFAKKYKLDIVEMEPDDSLWEKIEKEGWGHKATTYHLRDWLISRQRYWGAPIPMIHCEKCGWNPVSKKDLPVVLPTDVEFKPTGESPLVKSKTFQKDVTCPVCGIPAKREVDTMDTYVDSSWYFIRFVDPQNKDEFASQKAIKDWLPVDIYVGGGHVVQHLLFARFFWKVLYDEGLIDKSLGDEPFLKLRAPGWILGPDSRKMSKRWGNVITPDDVIPKYGADTLRMYEMFMGPFEAMKPWSITGVEGVYRFLKRVWVLVNQASTGQISAEAKSMLAKLSQKVEQDIEQMKFNTAVSAAMEFVNWWQDNKDQMGREGAEHFIKTMAPMIPFITEELWHRLGNKDSIHTQTWPKYDPGLIKNEGGVVVVQVGGKVRDKIEAGEDEEGRAKASDKIKKYLENKKYRTVLVPGKIVNFVLDEH